MYDQPLAAPEVRNKWPYQIPIGKGKSQATAKPLPTHPLSAGNASERITSQFNWEKWLTF